jgi:hypothetical protein
MSATAAWCDVSASGGLKENVLTPSPTDGPREASDMPTDDENESTETKRVQFWVEANVPITFDSDKLSNIAYSLAITTVRQIGYGEIVDHGYETDDEKWRTANAAC